MDILAEARQVVNSKLHDEFAARPESLCNDPVVAAVRYDNYRSRFGEKYAPPESRRTDRELPGR